MRNLEKKVDKGFSIKVDPNILWRQYNLRTATAIHKNLHSTS